jgi:hypothetical protein
MQVRETECAACVADMKNACRILIENSLVGYVTVGVDMRMTL